MQLIHSLFLFAAYITTALQNRLIWTFLHKLHGLSGEQRWLYDGFSARASAQAQDSTVFYYLFLLFINLDFRKMSRGQLICWTTCHWMNPAWRQRLIKRSRSWREIRSGCRHCRVCGESRPAGSVRSNLYYPVVEQAVRAELWSDMFILQWADLRMFEMQLPVKRRKSETLKSDWNVILGDVDHSAVSF